MSLITDGWIMINCSRRPAVTEPPYCYEEGVCYVPTTTTSNVSCHRLKLAAKLRLKRNIVTLEFQVANAP